MTLLSVAACTGTKPAAGDAGLDGGADTNPPSPFPDGAYQCDGSQGSGSCDEPFGTQNWSLTVAGNAVTIRIENVAFSAQDPGIPYVSCTGQWTDNRFDCASLKWWRQGRGCMAEMHLRAEPPSTISFWTGSADESSGFDRAACTRLP